MKGLKLIEFRGGKVIEGWPQKIAKEQKYTNLTYKNGKKYKRIRMGEKGDFDEGDSEAHKVKICHDCFVIKGEIHVNGCDAERCPRCRGQLISCGCEWKEYSP